MKKILLLLLFLGCASIKSSLWPACMVKGCSCMYSLGLFPMEGEGQGYGLVENSCNLIDVTDRLSEKICYFCATDKDGNMIAPCDVGSTTDFGKKEFCTSRSSKKCPSCGHWTNVHSLQECKQSK